MTVKQWQVNGQSGVLNLARFDSFGFGLAWLGLVDRQAATLPCATSTVDCCRAPLALVEGRSTRTRRAVALSRESCIAPGLVRACASGVESHRRGEPGVTSLSPSKTTNAISSMALLPDRELTCAA